MATERCLESLSHCERMRHTGGLARFPRVHPRDARNQAIVAGAQQSEHVQYLPEQFMGPELPGQSTKQVWFSGVHSDIGGSDAYTESGLWQITLEWVMCEAVALGLLVDPLKTQQALGRVPPSPPVAPDPSAATHNSLTTLWWILEFLPHSYYDAVLKRPRWRIPLGARRCIPEGSTLHSTVNDKCCVDRGYKPSNLPKDAKEEPRYSCSFE